MQNCQVQTILRNMPTLYRFHPEEVRKAESANIEKPLKETAMKPQRKNNSKLKALAEAIILQSLEDLWSDNHRRGSIEFFRGEGFKHCADIADMKVIDRLRLLKLLRKLNAKTFRSKHSMEMLQNTVL